MMEDSVKSTGGTLPGEKATARNSCSHEHYKMFLVILISLQLLAIVALCISFSVEINNLKTEMRAFKQHTEGKQDGEQTPGLSEQLLKVLSKEAGQTDLQVDIQQLFQGLNTDSVMQEDTLQKSPHKRSEAPDILSVSLNECFIIVKKLERWIKKQAEVINVLSGQLFQDISEINNRTLQLSDDIQQVNISFSQQVDDAEAQIEDTIRRLEVLGFPTFPAASCADIFPSLPSGKFYVKSSNGSTVRVYCDMELKCGGFRGGWQEVISVRVRRDCPRRFELTRLGPRLQVCIARRNGCVRIRPFSTYDVPYSRVCGKIIGYQSGSTDAFQPSIVNSSLTLSDQYLDGVSLTHGNFGTHIWSFAAGLNDSVTGESGCPCNNGSTISAPSFISDDYFCESGASADYSGPPVFTEDPLWDGKGCTESEDTCCNFNKPPWFFKELPRSTTDPIEMRVCRDDDMEEEATPIEIVELYVRP